MGKSQLLIAPGCVSSVQAYGSARVDVSCSLRFVLVMAANERHETLLTHCDIPLAIGLNAAELLDAHLAGAGLVKP